jgi:hypothetical protein
MDVEPWMSSSRWHRTLRPFRIINEDPADDFTSGVPWAQSNPEGMVKDSFSAR